MSEDRRVELIRQGVEAWERGEVDEALKLYAPDVVVHAPPEIGNAGTFHGIDGFLEWTRAWLEAWETFDQELLSLEPFGKTHAISTVKQTARGKGSGVEVERVATWVYEIRDEKLIYMAVFFDHDAAIAHAREREAPD